MARIAKILLYAVAGIVALLLVAGVLAYLLIDAESLGARVESEVEMTTGREFTIDGGIELSLFPWLAIDVGPTRVGNASGFGDDPFIQFESARLSVRLMPLILRQDVSIGTAALNGLIVNLAVDAAGVSNWQDLVDRQEAASELPQADESQDGGSDTPSIDIASINLRNASLRYTDARSGESYSITNVNLVSGRIGSSEPVPLNGGLSFALEPAGVSGDVSLDTTIAMASGSVTISDFEIESRIDGIAEVPADIRIVAPAITLDTEAERASPGDIEIAVFGVRLTAGVEPFSYGDSVEPTATISIDAFSPKSLMQTLGVEAPQTVDPGALERFMLDAKAAVSDEQIALSELTLVLDDTTLSGELSVPRMPEGSFVLQLHADTIDLNRYMAPADPDAAATSDAGGVPVEIPVELLRPLNARGKVTVEEAFMGDILFEDVELAVNAANGKLRAHPISATMFDGQYNGDIRIDVSGELPRLSVDERISKVSMNQLALAMFQQENVTGTINGHFTLAGSGRDMEAIRKTLSGDMAFDLQDGAFEGTDVWYQLRRARAFFKQEAAPEPVLPARTEFTAVKATGRVTNGVLRNDDLQADLPFMQITGRGNVDFVNASLDYDVNGRVFDKPDLMHGASPEEISDLTKTVIPFRISGPLAAPEFEINIEKIVLEQVEEEVRDQLIDKLLGGDEEPVEGDEGEDGEEKTVEDEIKDTLRDLLKR